MSKKRIIENAQPYHILARGVDKRIIFEDDADRCRMIFQMYVANIGSPAFNLRRRDIIKTAQAILVGEDISPKFYVKEHLPLVDILGFNLMPNHEHFILVQRASGGISKYVGKVNGGYSKYFNLRHGREGTLFQSRFKDIGIKTNAQLWAALRYIDVNGLDIFQSGWKEKGIKDWLKAKKYLEEYPWSSYPDHVGIRYAKLVAPPEVINKFLNEDLFGKDIKESVKSYKYFIEDWLKMKRNLDICSPYFLE